MQPASISLPVSVLIYAHQMGPEDRKQAEGRRPGCERSDSFLSSTPLPTSGDTIWVFSLELHTLSGTPVYPRALYLTGHCPCFPLSPPPQPCLSTQGSQSHLTLVEIRVNHLQHKFLKAQDGDADVIVFQFNTNSSSTQKLEQPSKCSNLRRDQ